MQSELVQWYGQDCPEPDLGGYDLSIAGSPAAAPLVRKSGFIDFSVATRALKGSNDKLRAALAQTNRPSEQNLLREMYFDKEGYERLSTTFRFRPGSSTLDNASLRDLRLLQDYLADLPAGAEIIFAGFTDSDGSFDANKRLSEKRASEVRAQLFALAGDAPVPSKTVSLKGYGELNPVGCNKEFLGQRLNRRVEVWVKTTPS